MAQAAFYAIGPECYEQIRKFLAIENQRLPDLKQPLFFRFVRVHTGLNNHSA